MQSNTQNVKIHIIFTFNLVLKYRTTGKLAIAKQNI